MARPGILYSHVAQAAAGLAESGKNPTVDSVRAALGSTGSKSTIAPLLKRWKAENQGAAAQAETGLPATLLEAMKGVYQHLQAEVHRKLEQAQAAHTAELQAAAEQARNQADAHQALTSEHAALAQDMEQAKDALKQLQAEREEKALALATAESDNHGLRQRLADRAAEVTALRKQLEQVRTQFEHYQEASVRQRSEERQLSEQRCLRLEQELSGARQRSAMQDAAIVRQEAQVDHLHGHNVQLRETIETLQAGLEQARNERESHARQLASLATAHEDERRLAAAAAQQALTEVRLALAAREKEVQLLTDQLGRAEARTAQSEQQALTLLQECAALRARLSVNKEASQNTESKAR